MIKVLIAEDSPTLTNYLEFILNSDPEIKVIGSVRNGKKAVEYLEKNPKPDVIVMDINMPEMDGIEATYRIMSCNPVPIIMMSSTASITEKNISFRAIEAGAVALFNKPTGANSPRFKEEKKKFIEMVKLMSEVKVVGRWNRLKGKNEFATAITPIIIEKEKSREIKMVAIGVSTGGPSVLQQILSLLPRDFPVPILIVQHIADGFLSTLVEWLNKISVLPLHIPADGEEILPGHVYFAPDNYHMGVKNGIKIALNNSKKENYVCPSISFLFRSVRENFQAHAIGVLLTGMGEDGADELKLMKEKGMVTIIQDKESSVVYGMPEAAIKLGAVTLILSPQEIAETLIRLTFKK